jgi:hypothetical protein
MQKILLNDKILNDHKIKGEGVNKRLKERE